MLHTVAGVAFLPPFVWYVVRHFLAWYRQGLTVVMVLGYGLAVATLVCCVSGIVLTVEGAATTRISALWDLVHLVSGIATTGLVVGHVALAVVRRAPSVSRFPELGVALRRFGLRSTVPLLAGALLVTGAAVLWPKAPVEFPIPDGYTLPSYAQEFDEYRGSPFAPTYARTESGMMVKPAALSGSDSCGTSGCHTDILSEWQPSAHRFSAMNPPFQAVQKNFSADREPAETRYCAGCHDPISLFAGAKDIQNMDLAAPGMQEGVSCVVCHTISKVDQRGNADYVLTPPQKYLWEGQSGLRKFLSDFLIRTYPRQHLADYDRNVLRTPEFCGACHKQFIPEALNRFGLSPGQNQYDEWRKSHWHVEDVEMDLSCRDCHMRLVPGSLDPGHGEDADVRRSPEDGAHRHHGMIATNFLMPLLLKLPNWETHVRLTEEWIRGETVIPEIAHLWPEGPVIPMEMTAPAEAEPGEEVSLRCVVTNHKVGHNFTTGPLDFMRAWIHLRVLDADGAVVAEWGAINPETRRITDVENREHVIGNKRDEGTMVLEGLPLDEHGFPLVEHQLWRKAGGKGQRVIFPRYSDNQVYRFQVPEDVRGPLRAVADLNFRRYRQEFLDLVLPGIEDQYGVTQPMVRQSTAEQVIRIVPATESTARAGAGR